jgi:phosphotriesterase-related protein
MFPINGNRHARLTDLEQMRVELERLTAAGGGCIVEVTPRNVGRNPTGLRELSEATNLHMVMGTGWYRERWYEPDTLRMSTQACAAVLIDEITNGCEDVRPGILGELGTDNAWISPLEERGFRAAARAHHATDLTLTTHAYGCDVGFAQLDLLLDERVDPGRVIIGHCDTYWNADYHLELAKRGAWVQFDTIRTVNAWEFAKRATAIERLVAAGHGHQVLLSQDICEQQFLATNGGAGYDCLLTSFLPFLLSRKVITSEQARLMTTTNPQRALHARPVPW